MTQKYHSFSIICFLCACLHYWIESQEKTKFLSNLFNDGLTVATFTLNDKYIEIFRIPFFQNIFLLILGNQI